MSLNDDDRRPFFVGWTVGERVATICFLVLSVFVVAQTVYFVSEDREAEARENARADAERECLADQIDATRDYLEQRGAIAEKDRASIRRVIDSFAEAAREQTQDPTPIIRALERYRKTQADLEDERADADLPSFPSGRCVEPSPPGEATKPPDDDPTEPEPSPTTQAEDEAAPAAKEQRKSERKGRKSPRKRPPAGGSTPRPPAPSPTPGLVIPLPDIELGPLSIGGDGIGVDLP